ncbi:MAG: hypothetical protein EOP84_14020 [Verrucomicrobiaceae bacterium]|nr:MAG: hypothetical protein EOP84_14020 [Verrucomicrobiaceae bacterium]
MNSHQKVTATRNRRNGVYELTLLGGSKFKVFICECYSFGEAEYLETTGRIEGLDAIVINSGWCAYTSEAKFAARADRVGVFSIGELMAALNKPQPWSYLTPEQRELYQKAGFI